MEKTIGIVMRTSPKVTVIYTKKGDFLEIPTPQEMPVVGQTIEVSLKPKRLFNFQNMSSKYTAAAAVLILVLSISVFSLLFIPHMAVASVALDINKGVELLINKDGKVIKIQDVNGGLGILEGITTKGLDVYHAVDLILENACSKGKLNNTQTLVLASVVPLNRWGTQIVDSEKLRNTIRDELTRRNMSGSIVVDETSTKIQHESKQQEMTVNSYLIYDRCKEKGIAIHPDTLRQDVQKALADANVTVSSLFPEESCEVKVESRKVNSSDTKQEPNLQNASEHNQSSNMESDHKENHIDQGKSASKASSSPEVTEHSLESSHEPSAETSYDLSVPISDQDSTDHSLSESSSQQSTNNSLDIETGPHQEHPLEEEDGLNNQPQSNMTHNLGEHTERDRED